MASEPVPVLIIVTGPPGSGKTTLSQRLAAELDLVLVHRDSLKEILFDVLGSRDRAWSQQLGIASYQLLYYLLATCLRMQRSFIVESNFDTGYDTPRMLDLKRQYPFYPYQIVCRTDAAILLERLQRRTYSGERHPGHGDQEDIGKLDLARMQAPSPLDIGGTHIDLDTTDFAKIDYTTLCADLRRILHPTGSCRPEIYSNEQKG